MTDLAQVRRTIGLMWIALFAIDVLGLFVMVVTFQWFAAVVHLIGIAAQVWLFRWSWKALA